MSLLARRLADLLAAPLRRSEMIEPLENRLLLTQTSVLNDPSFITQSPVPFTKTYTAAVNVPHTHIQAGVSTSLYPADWYGPMRPSNHPTLTVEVEGVKVREIVWGWPEYSPD